MDQVFDALSTEMPYDQVANTINSSIQTYKDGKDRDLIGGTSDYERRKSEINRFYDKLKSEINKEHGSDNNLEIETVGTQYGRHIISEQRDVIERAEESFDIKKFRKFVGKSNNFQYEAFKSEFEDAASIVDAQCSAYLKLNKNISKIFKDDKTPIVDNISDAMKNNNSKISDIIATLDKSSRTYLDVSLPENLPKLADLIRETIAVIKPVSAGSYGYYRRYAKRYKVFKDIISEETSAIEKFTFKPDFDELEKSGKVILEKSINMMFDYSESNVAPSDPFPFKPQKYKININTFYMTTINPSHDIAGITLKDSKREWKNTGAFGDNDVKTAFAVLKGVCGQERLRDIMQSDSIIGSGKISMSPAGKGSLDLLEHCEDMTVGEFYRQVSEFAKYADDLDTYLKRTIDVTLSVCDDAFFKVSKMAKAIVRNFKSTDVLRNPPNSAIAKIGYTMMSVGLNGLFDTMSLVETMETCNALDNIRKYQLLTLTTSLIKCYNAAIRSALGE